jgi:hypothetical protein
MSYGVERPSILGSYLDSQIAYLKTIYPEKSERDLEDFVKRVMRDKLVRPRAKIIHHPSPGNSELIEVDLLSHIKENSRRIITPGGTIYKSTDEQVAFDKQFIDMLRNNRDKAKKQMLQYAAEGRNQEKALEDYKQSLCKILVNSIIGSNGNDKNAMYDLESFNGVTSMARHGVIMAYAYTERFLTSNFYFPNREHAINYIITTKKFAPSKDYMNHLTSKYSLANPFAGEVAECLCASLNQYTSSHEKNLRVLTEILEGMPQHEVTFIYYSRNLYNLFTTNTEFWKMWMNDFFNTHKEVTEEEIRYADPGSIRKIDGDLLQVMATVHSDMLNGVQIKKVGDSNEQLAKLLVVTGQKMQQKLELIDDLLTTFLHNGTFISHIHSQRNIIRKCVGISDTDSVIFTTKHLVTWYLGGKYSFCQDTYNSNALIVYLLTKSIASLIRHMSISRGATGDNIEMIEMKNEYFYPVLIKTGIGKHYAGNITIQEGNVLPTPETDIKGVAFMSSNLPKITHDFTKKIIANIQKDMMENCEIRLTDFIIDTFDYEQAIFKSLKSGEFTYFPNIAIRAKEEYKKPESSVYVNYELWQAVFAEKYGDINIPTKVPIIPINEKAFRDPQYLNWLNMKNPSIHDKLVKYMDALPKKKKIGRIPLANSLTTVPEEIIPIIKMRPIVFKNLQPTQLALKSIGLNLGNAKKCPLVSDYYSELVVPG